jgi:signal peptidase I
VNKLAYGLKVPFTTWHLMRWDTPERGEVVVFNSPDGVRLVKRVIGLPGDVIELRDGRLFINGQGTEYRPSDASFKSVLSEEERNAFSLKMEVLGDHPHPVMQHQASWGNYRGMRVADGHYFMMGDNRDNSKDSRYPEVGVVPLSQILGRSSRVAMSFDYERWYVPRWERFFKPLP